MIQNEVVDMLSLIIARRDGKHHSDEDLKAFADGVAKGSFPDYQLAAWLMAAYLNPLSDKETVALTLAMADTGERMDLTGLPKPWLDKHSTGGVGDKTTIILLPLLASCGLTLVKMSGRGLGITGGTLDKLQSIPGFRVDLTPSEMKAQAGRIGLAITGQTPNLAPADKPLYALRDVTGTVGSIPLLVSSILSKKIAGGADTIVLDVKNGSGTLTQTSQMARALAAALSKTAKACGLKCRIAMTDMNQPLGSAGNAIEIEESLKILRGEWDNDAIRRCADLVLDLAGIALEATEVVPDRAAGRALAEDKLQSGAALKKAAEWFNAQGGSIDARLPASPVVRVVEAPTPGWVAHLDSATVGKAVIVLGGGRLRKEDSIDPSVGIGIPVCIGSRVEKGQPLFTVHAASEAAADEAEKRVRSAFGITPFEVPRPAIIQSVT
jgi:pyrimidine-nucleoside phosphorylase